MSEQEFVLAILGMVGSFSVVWGLGYAVFTWMRERRGPTASPQTLNDIQRQVAEIQTSVDAIALEVERISEGQRFATRLMAERTGAPQLEQGDRER